MCNIKENSESGNFIIVYSIKLLENEVYDNSNFEKNRSNINK